jgi:type II secretory pathway pseudopilin PulG
MTQNALHYHYVQFCDFAWSQSVETGNVGRSRSPRSGFTLLAVMLGIFLVGVFSMSILQSILQRHRIQSRELHEIQCGFLLQSGLERAAMRLARDPEYAGEHWRLRRSSGENPLLEDIPLSESGSHPESGSQENSNSEESEELEKALEVTEPGENDASPIGNEPTEAITEFDSLEIAGEVLIEVLSDDGQNTNRKFVRVTTRYPYLPQDRVQISEEFVVQVPQPNTPSSTTNLLNGSRNP